VSGRSGQWHQYDAEFGRILLFRGHGGRDDHHRWRREAREPHDRRRHSEGRTINSGGTAAVSGAVNGTSTIALSTGTLQATTIHQDGTDRAARNFNWNSGTIQNLSGTNLTVARVFR
jgi:hypothetical protein